MNSNLEIPTGTRHSSATKIECMPFNIAPFVRVSWASDRLKAKWESRIRRVAEACLAVEENSVLIGLRACGLITLTSSIAASKTLSWIRSGFFGVPIDSYRSPNRQSSANCSTSAEGTAIERYLFGIAADVSRCQTALEEHDDVTAASLLGCPPCCAKFASTALREWGVSDLTWPSAANSFGREPIEDMIELTGEVITNQLWRALGVRILPHFPCGLGCAPSIELGKSLVDVACSSGFDEEMKWMAEILAWPVEWSALHGIAQIKTPILKISTSTDATPRKYTVRLSGSAYPDDALAGNYFPYIPPAKKFTEKRGFQLGLINANSLGSVSQPHDHAPRARGVLDAVYDRLFELEKTRVRDVNISRLCTSGYYTAVELSDGSQGIATNFFNIRGPYAQHYEQTLYDAVLNEFARTDSLLEEFIIRPSYIDPLAQSIKVALANALSEPLVAPDMLSGFQVNDGALNLGEVLECGDEVMFVDCAGSAVCRSITDCTSRLKLVNFCDLGLESPFRAEVQDFFDTVFGSCGNARIIENAGKEGACRSASVVVVEANAICTDSLDKVLDWSQNAREVLVIGRSYAMDPVPLFRRGATGLSTYRIMKSGLIDYMRRHDCTVTGDVISYDSWFAPVQIRRSLDAMSPAIGKSVNEEF